MALLGTNGAGKTTTVETLEGLRPTSQGTVRVLGRDPYRERAATRREVGVMLQEGGFAGDLTVFETADLWRGIASRPCDVPESLRMLDLEHRRDVRVKQLSGGERRRLDVLLATMTRPKVLFLDEPTTGLDPESRKGAWDLIRRLREDGTTILLTTHYLEEAELLADRIVVMHEGRIASTGTLDEVLRQEPSSISFEVAPGTPLTDLPVLEGDLDPAALDDHRVYVQTGHLQRDLARLLSWADRNDVEMLRFRAQQASLNEVFHAVVQR
ncbi:MAG TPA: ABC transporter ATP-binding protein [Actinoplanes sp.]|nr:ABC transporter ATP-binding protein [Actinoplanes sp.]